jgi:type 2 lantibiotic biosynthesis protein LanM
MLDKKDFFRSCNLLEYLNSLEGSSISRALRPEIKRRIMDWQESIFLSDKQFTRRLAEDDITRFKLAAIIECEMQQNGPREIPWFRMLAAIEESAPSYASLQTKLPFPKERRSFLQFASPFVSWAEEELRKFLLHFSAPLNNLPVSGLIDGLEFRLLEIATRTLVYELNQAHQKGLLAGNSKYERFESFVERLTQPSLRAELFMKYPVLARLLTEVTRLWVEQVKLLLTRLSIDKPRFSQAFHVSEDLDPIVLLEDIPSDPHGGGKQVWKIVFANGLRLVYKPRSIAIEHHFQEMLVWLNSFAGIVDFQILSILDCGQYGWEEYVEKSPCNDRSGVARFYLRMGGYLALFYLLQGTDFHHGNLIAAGEYPIVLDLEGLFQNSGSQLASSRWLEHSVLATGFLPTWIEQADVSALGGRIGGKLSTRIPVWQKPNTDEMYLDYEYPPSISTSSVPMVVDKFADPLQYKSEIEAGFDNVYNLVQKHRSSFLDSRGPLYSFRKDETRFFARSTRTYDLILWGSHHPRALISGLDHDRSLDRIWISAKQVPYLWKLARHERSDLWNEDIPLFTSRPNSKSLWNSKGKELKGFFPSTSISRIERRIASLGTTDHDLQRSYIRASLSALSSSTRIHKTDPCKSFETVDSFKPATREVLIAEALEIGNELARLAVTDQNQANWISFIKGHGENWGLAPMLPTLYDGTAGVALFLGYLASLIPESGAEKLAYQAHGTCIAEIDEWNDAGIGAFSGLSGVLFSHVMLQLLWNKPLLDITTQILLDRIEIAILKNDHFDVMDGTAGCLLVLLELYDLTKSNRACELALSCGEHLLKMVIISKKGFCWYPGSKSKPSLTGFAHGAAGIAAALFRLDDVLNVPAARQAAQAAIDFERRWFSPDVVNWIDRRSEIKDNKIGSAWCHGAGGVGLGRLISLQFVNDQKIEEEVEIALNTLCREGFGADHSLCHGSFGSCEILLEAADVLGEYKWTNLARKHATAILQEKSLEGSFRSGLSVPTMPVGMMVGLAGIGIGLLHLAFPNHVPSVLGLHAPRAIADFRLAK